MKRFARQHPASRQENLAPPRFDELVVRRLYANSFSTPWHRTYFILNERSFCQEVGKYPLEGSTEISSNAAEWIIFASIGHQLRLSSRYATIVQRECLHGMGT